VIEDAGAAGVAAGATEVPANERLGRAIRAAKRVAEWICFMVCIFCLEGRNRGESAYSTGHASLVISADCRCD